MDNHYSREDPSLHCRLTRRENLVRRRYSADHTSEQLISVSRTWFCVCNNRFLCDVLQASAEKEEAFKSHFYSNPTELTEAFQRNGLMDMEPPDALRMFARNFMADEDKLRDAQEGVGPRAVLALKYRQGQHLLLGELAYFFSRLCNCNPASVARRAS